MASYKLFIQALGDYATNAYLLVEDTRAIAFDAPPGAVAFYKAICDEYALKLNTLLLTHSHFDHIADAAKIQKMGVKIGVNKHDLSNCLKPGSDFIPLMMPVVPFKPDFTFSEGKHTWDGFDFEILETPGHSPGGCCFIYKDLLFSGDTLFKGTIGNLSFPTSSPSAMKRSLEKLTKLDSKLIVYPGHGPKTRLGQEKPYLQQLLAHLGDS